MSGTLYLVPTPIGNLGDISPRMAQTMAQADFIAAEDTRVTMKLLNHLELKKPMVSYYRHNSENSGQSILQRLLAGESCALVTDAGTPAISDPGEDLVALCAQNGVPVVSIPGPCALVTALAASGQPTGRFTFEGFLAMNKKNRRRHLDSLRGEERTMIFYEAPHKLPATLKDLAATFGPERPISLCRELSKLHEEIRRTTLGEAVDYYDQNPPRGEFVLVVRGAEPAQEEEATLEDGLARVRALREEGASLRDAVKQAASAEYNLVVSPSALETAKYLQKQFGTPYVVGYPLVKNMLPEADYTGKKVLIVHQQVMANALREELKVRGASEVKVCSWFDLKPELREEDDVYLKEEDDFTELAADSKWDVVIADDCMKSMLPEFGGQFIGIRHFAVSGKLGGAC